jgi:hypothetical protein
MDLLAALRCNNSAKQVYAGFDGKWRGYVRVGRYLPGQVYFRTLAVRHPGGNPTQYHEAIGMQNAWGLHGAIITA